MSECHLLLGPFTTHFSISISSSRQGDNNNNNNNSPIARRTSLLSFVCLADNLIDRQRRGSRRWLRLLQLQLQSSALALPRPAAAKAHSRLGPLN